MRCSWPLSVSFLMLVGQRSLTTDAFMVPPHKMRRTGLSTRAAKMNNQGNEPAQKARRRRKVVAPPFMSPLVFRALQNRASDKELHGKSSCKGAANFQRILGYPKGLALQSYAKEYAKIWKSEVYNRLGVSWLESNRASQMREWESIKSESDLFIPQLGEFDIVRAYRGAVNMNRRTLRLRAMKRHAYHTQPNELGCFPEDFSIAPCCQALYLSLVYAPNTFDVMSDGYDYSSVDGRRRYFRDAEGFDDGWFVDKYDLQVQGYFGDAMDSVESTAELSAIDMHHTIRKILQHQHNSKASVTAKYQGALQQESVYIARTRMDMADSNLYDHLVNHFDAWKEPENLRHIHAAKRTVAKLYEDRTVDDIFIPGIVAAAEGGPLSIHQMAIRYHEQFGKYDPYSQEYHYGFRDRRALHYLEDHGRIKVIRSTGQYIEAAKIIGTHKKWDEYFLEGGHDKHKDLYSIFVVLHEDHPEGEGKPIAMARRDHPDYKDHDHYFDHYGFYPTWQIAPSEDLLTNSSPLDIHFHEYFEVIKEWVKAMKK